MWQSSAMVQQCNDVAVQWCGMQWGTDVVVVVVWQWWAGGVVVEVMRHGVRWWCIALLWWCGSCVELRLFGGSAVVVAL